MDPQQRFLLMVAYEAFEQAGLRLEDLKQSNTGGLLVQNEYANMRLTFAGVDSLEILQQQLAAITMQALFQEPIKQMLGEETIFVAPQGKFRTPNGFDWLEKEGIEVHLALKPSRAKAVLSDLEEFIEELTETCKVARKRIISARFSQGGMMGLLLAVTPRKPFVALLSFSRVPLDLKLVHQVKLHKRTPILMVHGAADQVISLAAYERCIAFLEAEGFNYETEVYPNLGHELEPKSFELMANYLQKKTLS